MLRSNKYHRSSRHRHRKSKTGDRNCSYPSVILRGNPHRNSPVVLATIPNLKFSPRTSSDSPLQAGRIVTFKPVNRLRLSQPNLLTIW
jgi:hypothetical protein